MDNTDNLSGKRSDRELLDHAPTAPDGSVTTLAAYSSADFSSSDAVLCRVTAPLVSLAFGFIKRNVGVRILGREIGQGLVTLVKKMNAQDIDDLESKLRRWSDRETRKCYARGHDSAAAAIEDKFSCLSVFIDQLSESNRTIAEILRRIEDLFTNNHLGLLTLCTVHKAKGLEWERVFILDRDKYMPSKWAKQEWEKKQERNLLYVAITRAKLDLRYIKSSCWFVTKAKEPSPIAFVSRSVEQQTLDILDAL